MSVFFPVSREPEGQIPPIGTSKRGFKKHIPRSIMAVLSSITIFVRLSEAGHFSIGAGASLAMVGSLLSISNLQTQQLEFAS